MKIKKRYSCSSCGSIFPKWTGQCFDCGSWGSVEEESFEENKVKFPTGTAAELETLDGPVEEKIRIETPIKELNGVLGGGIVEASAILVGGDPGIGKSTLLLQLSCGLSSMGKNCLYVSGEESTGQIKLRARRLGLESGGLRVTSLSLLEDIFATLGENNFDLVIIDSIQTVQSAALSSAAGTVSQIKHCSSALVSYAKRKNIAIILACHVTKEGELAGPKLLEHVVDTVLYFEGDGQGGFRILRSIKNRFGPIDEIGLFEMTDSGLKEVQNPSDLFLPDSNQEVSGCAIFASMEGNRPILVETQALIAPSPLPMPRRSVVGWDLNRLSMILAVLNVRFGLDLSGKEVYLTIAGGMKIREPAADLAVAAALVSAATKKAWPKNSVFFGEIGLSGEVRKVNRCPDRIKESRKLGFTNIICPKTDDAKTNALNHISELKKLMP